MFFSNIDPILPIIGGVILGVIILIFILTYVAVVKKKNSNKRNEVGKVKIVDGVRYTEDKAVTDGSERVIVTVNQGDIVLKQGVTYVASKKKGDLLPGKYTVLSSAGEQDKFNIRLGTFVREYSHFSDIVIGEGEEITPVSHSIVLR